MSLSPRYSHLLHGCAIAVAAAGICTIAQPATATTFKFDLDRDNGNLYTNNAAGVFQEISASYNDNSDQFSWSSTFSATQNGSTPNGGWLVVTDGPNPKGQNGHAIFYIDGISGALTAYSYSGANSSNSWRTEQFLDSWEDAVQLTTEANGEKTLSFSIDATEINNANLGADWEGVQFNDKIGVWFHTLDDLDIDYNYDDQGEITGISNFSYGDGAHGWYDTGHRAAEAVPEPSIGLLAFAAAGLMVKRSRRRNEDEALDMAHA